MKVLFAVQKLCSKELQLVVLEFFQKGIATQEKATAESINAELGIASPQEDNQSEKINKMTFLEGLLSGDLDLGKIQEQELQEARKDSASEVRLLITRCFPAFLQILKGEPGGLGRSHASGNQQDYSDSFDSSSSSSSGFSDLKLESPNA